jgi:hypothetical protein
MLNGSSAYGVGTGTGTTVTGADGPGAAPLLWWLFPARVWRP